MVVSQLHYFIKFVLIYVTFLLSLVFFLLVPYYRTFSLYLFTKTSGINNDVLDTRLTNQVKLHSLTRTFQIQRGRERMTPRL